MLMPEHGESPSPAAVEIVEVEADSALLGAVIALGNGPAKRWLGPMPDAGFADRARKGTLLAAVKGTQTVGYVLYDLPVDRVKIGHLCVAAQARGEGIARQLVDAVSRRHAERRGVELACRRDYPADALWAHLGFRPASTRTGRSKAQHPLTIWLLDHGHPDLFTALVSDGDRAALDNMVFLDLVEAPEQRPEGAESRELLSDWLAEYVDLCITDEVFHEIDRVTETAHRTSLQSRAGSYVNISRGLHLDDHLVATVAALAPKAGTSDHCHVARAVLSGATYLVSRDDDLLRAARSIERELGLVVLRPAALIARLDRQRSEGRYLPRALRQTDLVDAQVGEHDLNDFSRALLNHGAGEHMHELVDILRPAVAAPHRHDVRIIRDSAVRPIGGFVRYHRGRDIEVPLLRVAGTDGLATALARQLAFDQRQAAALQGGGRVIVRDSHPSTPILQALPQESYESGRDATWTCDVRTGIVAAAAVFDPEGDQYAQAVAWEQRHWPQKVVDAGIPSFLVPINVAYAEQLLDPGLAARTLLPRQTHLGLGREHVYYRRPRNHSGLVPGARILWYVTGSAASHPRGSLRAVSTVAEVTTGTPDQLYHRFARLGVYSQEEVRRTADAKRLVMAVRFVDTEVLADPLGLDELRALYTHHGESFEAPASPRLVTEHMFCLLYARSCRHGS